MKINKFIVNVIAALFTVIISGIILYETMVENNILGEIGLFGIFLSSLFSHLTVIGRGIFGPTFLILAQVYNPLVIGFFAGWGGAIGEVTTYYIGLTIREAVNEGKENSFREWIDKYGLILILLLAATPLPDTPIILLAGSSRFPVIKILIIEGFGKSLFYSFGAFFGVFIFVSLSDIVGSLITSTVIVGASIALCVLLTWEKSRKKIFKIGKKALRIKENP